MNTTDLLEGVLSRTLTEGQEIKLGCETWSVRKGILRSPTVKSFDQNQTGEVFGFKWARTSTFSRIAEVITPTWLAEKYGVFSSLEFLSEHDDHPIVLDAGCGAAMSGLAMFAPAFDRIRYLGIDVSPSVDAAQTALAERGLNGSFVQCSIDEIPLPDSSIDVIFSEGVLHHTDDTFNSLTCLAELLKPRGRILFYVYKKKGPIREFTDDYVREQIRGLNPDQAWEALMPLTKLGKTLGDLDIEITIQDDIEVLGIPKGAINLQRLFYWHIFKAFFHPSLDLDEMNHINFDWYAPLNARRHTVDEVTNWCQALGLQIELLNVEDAGITVVARKGRA